MSARRFVRVCTVQGELAAGVIKSHLESEGIPALLKYESLGRVLSSTVDGLGAVSVLVPQDQLEEARRIIEPCEDTGEDETPGA